MSKKDWTWRKRNIEDRRERERERPGEDLQLMLQFAASYPKIFYSHLTKQVVELQLEWKPIMPKYTHHQENKTKLHFDRDKI